MLRLQIYELGLDLCENCDDRNENENGKVFLFSCSCSHSDQNRFVAAKKLFEGWADQRDIYISYNWGFEFPYCRVSPFTLCAFEIGRRLMYASENVNRALVGLGIFRLFWHHSKEFDTHLLLTTVFETHCIPEWEAGIAESKITETTLEFSMTSSTLLSGSVYDRRDRSGE